MQEFLAARLVSFLADVATVDAALVLLVVLLVISVIVLDAVTAEARREEERSGMGSEHVTVSIDGGTETPVRGYVSVRQGLAGKPDAVVMEEGRPVPVERKPLARKVRDRHVAQLLVYMRLVEEFEGSRPTHGYLILGPKAKRVRIDNTPERQAWLDSLLVDMRRVLSGAPATAAPHPKKCRNCQVATFCASRADAPAGDAGAGDTDGAEEA